MKKLIKSLGLLVAAQLMCFQANAGLISAMYDQASYNTNDIISIDFIVDNTSETVAEVEFDFSFDNTLLNFDNFEFDIDVDLSAFIIDAYLKEPTILNVYSLWFDSFDTPSGNFLLGTASFSALNNFNVNSQNGQLLSTFVADADGFEVTAVSEPATGIIMLSSLLLLAGYRKASNK